MSERITLHIENLALEAIIGVLDSERHTPQKLILDAQITYIFEVHKPYLDYVRVCDYITQTLQEQQYTLLESALSDISARLKACFSDIIALSITIKKPEILSHCIVGASIEKCYER